MRRSLENVRKQRSPQTGNGTDGARFFIIGEDGNLFFEEKISEYEKRFGNIINTDSAKLLFKDEGYNPHDIESVKKFHPQASAIVRSLFEKFLRESKGNKNGIVVFTGGGTGSGKSSMMNNSVVKNADFVFDSTMVNFDAAKNSIQRVIDNGQIPLITFVYRDPADAWFNGILRRNKNIDGHIVPEATFANTHAISKENFLRLADEFGDKVLYIITEVKNGLKEPIEISIEELENKPKYTKEQIQEAIHAETYSEARAILEGFKNSNDSESLKRISPVVEGTIIQ